MSRKEERPAGASGSVGSLRRGLDILEMFANGRESIGIGEMAVHLEIHKSSASRLASTLARSGFLQKSNALGVYRLGGRLAALGAIAAKQVDLVDSVLPHLQMLTQLTGETGHLAVLDGALTKTIAITDGWHTVRMHTFVGKTNAAYCSSMGKALLAGLPESTVRDMHPEGSFEARTEHTITNSDDLIENLRWIRENSYALDDEELEIGLRCIAAPIFSADGDIPASISISGPSQRVTLEVVEEAQRLVRWFAWQASLALGAVQVPNGFQPPPSEEPPSPSWLDAEKIPDS